MATHALPQRTPESMAAPVGGGNESCRGNPLDEGCSRRDLHRVKADLQAVTADLDQLRGKLLNALNKGLVLNELGGILTRLEDLWQSIPDETSALSQPPAARHHP